MVTKVRGASAQDFTSIDDIKNYDAPVGAIIELNAGGRSGVFDVIAGDFSAEVVADTANGVYIPVSGDPTALTRVAKRRAFNNYVESAWFGCDNEGTAETGAELEAFVDFVNAQTGTQQIEVRFTPGIYLITGGSDLGIGSGVSQGLKPYRS